MSVGILFPGQGSQFVGMGEELFEARPDLLGENADEIVGFSLREMCLSGPEDELTRTEHAQPALFALSFALWEAFAGSAGVEPAGAAGHSLGEYTALAAAGVLGYETALDLVARRGRAMAEAADARPSGMAALIGADEATAREIVAARVESGGNLQVANINGPGQVVVAGGSIDIEWLTQNSSGLGVRAIPLRVAGAFHSGFMAPASEAVARALEKVELGRPRFPVWANTTARPHEPDEIKDVLARQVVEPVLFADSLTDMARSGIDTFVHVGPGDITAGLARRALDDVTVHVVSSMTDVHSVRAAIGTMGEA